MIGMTASLSIANTSWARDEGDAAALAEKEIQDAIAKLQPTSGITKPDLQSLITKVEAYHQLLSSCQAPERSESSYYERWDQEMKLLQDIEEWVRKTDLSWLEPVDQTIEVKTPLVAMTFLRGERNKQDWDRLFHPRKILSEIMKEGKPVRDVTVFQEYFSRSETHLLTQIDDSQVNCKSAMKTRILEMKTAATRFYLELPSEITGAWTSGPENHSSPLRWVYRGLKSSLFELNRAYLESRFKPAPEKTPVFDLEWRKLNSRGGPHDVKGTVVLRRNSPLEIPPGIHETSDRLVIFAPEVRFHPNAVIVTRGDDISINAQRVVAPWLDASGDEPTNKNGHPGGTILLNLERPLDEVIGTPLLVSMGSSGRWLECANGVPEFPGNGGNGGDIIVRGGPYLGIGSNFLNIAGSQGGLYCNGRTIEGEPGRHKPPSLVSRLPSDF
jgi:hypothetical protein